MTEMTGIEMKEARQELGLSVRDMATALGLSENNGERRVRRMESGEQDISGPVIVVLEAMAGGFIPSALSAIKEA